MILKVFYCMLFSASLAFKVAIYKRRDYLNNNDSFSLDPVLTVNETYRFGFDKDEKLNVDIRVKNKLSHAVASISITDGEPTEYTTPESEFQTMTHCKNEDCYEIKNKKIKTHRITVGIELMYFGRPIIQIILQGTSGDKDNRHGDLCLKTSCVMEIDLKNISQGTQAPPEPPTLISPKQQGFKEGDQFIALCIVPRGRPAAKITWLLDDVEVLTGVYPPVVRTEPRFDLQTISQNFSRSLTADDNNKMLICRAEHEALQKSMEAKRQLNVQYPPKRQEADPITIFGLKLGAEGRLNVTVRANPKPTAEWTMGKQVLAAPRQSDNGEFTALEPLFLSDDYYNITLILARIAKEDIDRTYYLRVDNGLGREEFTVRISTMDKSADAKNDYSIIIISSICAVMAVAVVLFSIFAIKTSCWKKNGQSQTPRPPLPLPLTQPYTPYYENVALRGDCELPTQEEPHYEEVIYH